MDQQQRQTASRSGPHRNAVERRSRNVGVSVERPTEGEKQAARLALGEAKREVAGARRVTHSKHR